MKPVDFQKITNNPFLVSAIVSIYKSGKFIEHKLKNLLAQTIKDKLEIIIVDSNSPENEQVIVEKYAKDNVNIRYIRTKERETIYEAWNRGIRLASGKYITNSNADDVLRNDALQIMVNELENNPDIALVYADYFITNSENATFTNHIKIGHSVKPDYSPDIMLSGCHMGPQPMWRKSIHNEIGYFDEDFISAGDYEFWCRMATKYKMKHIKIYLGLYYHNQNGIVNSNTGLSIKEAERIKYRYKDKLPEIDKSKNYPVDYYFDKSIKNNDFVNICMVTYNRLKFTKESIASVIEYTKYPYVLTIIDNSSGDGTKEYLIKLKNEGIIKNLILLNKNIGVAKASNIGWLLEPESKYYFKIDNDIVIQKYNWLSNMVEIINGIGKIGAIAYNFEPISYELSKKKGYKIRIKRPGNLGGACILIPERTKIKVGYWSEEYGLYGEEDADYGARIRFSKLLNVYMADENIGVHLPAGKAAKINAETFEARDGIEEEEFKEYRKWKDEKRKKNVEKGPFGYNIKAYKKGDKLLYFKPNYAISYIVDNLPELKSLMPIFEPIFDKQSIFKRIIRLIGK